MKKVSLSFILDNLTELGWDYTAGRMSRSGMEIYDGIMRHVGVLDPTEHWNEDVYSESNGNWQLVNLKCATFISGILCVVSCVHYTIINT